MFISCLMVLYSLQRRNQYPPRLIFLMLIPCVFNLNKVNMNIVNMTFNIILTTIFVILWPTYNITREKTYNRVDFLIYAKINSM